MREDPLRVASLEPGFIDACAAIVGRLELFRVYRYGEEAARRGLTAALADGRADLLVALAPGAVVTGFAWFVPRGAFDRSGYLRLIAVDDRFQGQGVGQILMDELERRHLAAGGIVLLASAQNTAAHRFYERRGYRHVGELPDYVGSGLHERIYYRPPG
jgi:ribosomal protein S18 acetylase RimI-like enzyme